MTRADESLAVRDAAPAKAFLMERYGSVPPVVYFIQRRPDGPIKIGHAHMLVSRFEAFYNACPDPVIVRAVIPGGQPLEHWFHRRHAGTRLFNEWYESAESVAADAVAFATIHAAAFASGGDLTAAVREAVCRFDQTIADMERLYNNGVAGLEIAKMAGLGYGEFRAQVERMRALGFDMGYRHVHASRRPRADMERRVPELGCRRIIG
jgi:hypothetical protein